MNSLTKHLSLKTALNSPLAQMSCAALIAYLSLNLGTTGLRRQKSQSAVTGGFSRAGSACKLIRAKHLLEELL